MKFIDFFAGIGGFRRGMELAGHECVGFCEFDKFATASYISMHLLTEEQRKTLEDIPIKKRQKEILKEEYRNGEWYANDIRRVYAGDIPKADCWCFGFPCFVRGTYILTEKGFIPKEDIKTFRNVNSYLQGHPDMNKVPGVDMSTGSLGQGVSAAGGMALAAKLDNKDYRVYSVLGDGELEEGQVWEQAMFAAHYKLDNFTIFVDNNGLQIDGDISKVMNPNPIDKKFEAFGWHVIKVSAHNFEELMAAVDEAKATKGQPTAIIMKSVKGKNVSFMENNAGWHGSAPNEEQYNQAIAELDEIIKGLEASL